MNLHPRNIFSLPPLPRRKILMKILKMMLLIWMLIEHEKKQELEEETEISDRR